jgi:hypothetical protein
MDLKIPFGEIDGLDASFTFKQKTDGIPGRDLEEGMAQDRAAALDAAVFEGAPAVIEDDDVTASTLDMGKKLMTALQKGRRDKGL